MTLLFLVVQDDTVIYPAPGILELFRLKKIFNVTDEAKVYRFVAGQKYSDRYFRYDSDKLSWIVSDCVFGTGFAITSFKALEMGYKMLGGK